MMNLIGLPWIQCLNGKNMGGTLWCASFLYLYDCFPLADRRHMPILKMEECGA